MYKLITRADAIEQGVTRYFTGKECKNGHVAPRKASNGCCTECARILTKRWRDEGKHCEMTKAKTMPSTEYLDSCFNLKDGVLYWSARSPTHFSTLKGYNIFVGRLAGKPAGHINKRHGYIEVRLDGLLYKAHRLIYKIVNDVEPKYIVDHIDGDVSNNYPSNLREATSMENARNSNKRKRNGTSEYKGVLLRKGCWYSSLTVDDVSSIIPSESEEQAARDYDRRATEEFGEFANLNFN